MKTATFTWTAGTGSDAGGAAIEQPKAATRSKGHFDSLLDHNGSFLTFGLLLLAASVFGAQHALGPGHGKTVVAAYLVGSRGTVRHAAALGLTVTATHTSSVYVLGFITLAAAEFISPEKLYLYLGLVSGLSIVVMGLLLFRARLRKARHHLPEDGLHRHGLFGKAHSHIAVNDGDEHGRHGGAHGHDQHEHQPPVRESKLRILRRRNHDAGADGALRGDIPRQEPVCRSQHAGDDQAHPHEHAGIHRHSGELVMHLPAHHEHRQMEQDPGRHSDAAADKCPDRMTRGQSAAKASQFFPRSVVSRQLYAACGARTSITSTARGQRALGLAMRARCD